MATRSASEVLAGLPEPWPASLLARIRRVGGARTLVVLDDDPTGTQTVRDVAVVLDPSIERLGRALDAEPAVLFVLTNSRSLPEAGAVALARRLGARIRAAATRSGREVTFVSRSDSTLRGHFPAEVDALAAAAGIPEAPMLFMPYLGEAGRITVGDVHYLVRAGLAVPVAETEFARDRAFAYSDSDLRAWIAARLRGASRPIESLPLELLRTGGPDAVAAALRTAPPRAIVIANAADDRDAEVVAAGVASVEHERPVLARTAAGYVRARAGQPLAPLLELRELRVARGSGLVVVGSHVATTSRQLATLLANPPVAVEHVEVAVADAADHRRGPAAVRATVRRARAALERGAVPIVATSRDVLAPASDDPGGLRLAVRLSRALAAIVRQLEPLPGWIIAKGGITSSDVATLGLGAAAATVVGPLLPGVPVWRARRERGRPEAAGGSGEVGATVDLVVFPGNVGDDDALRAAVARLSEAGG